MNKRLKIILIFAVLMTVLCLAFASCGDSNKEEAAKDESVAASEQTDKTENQSKKEQAAKKAKEKAAEEKAKAEKETAAKETEYKAEEKAAPKTDEHKAEEYVAPETAEEKASEDTSKNDKTSKNNKPSKSSSAKTKPKEKKKVWVEPVTETHTVTLDTGTRYCCGANSNGGCGASWHGSKDDTYDSWHKHWQDYVKKRTAEEEAEGRVYVCDHIHDDSKWVPDTTTEEVIVKEGYWKEVE